MRAWRVKIYKALLERWRAYRAFQPARPVIVWPKPRSRGEGGGNSTVR